MRSRQGFTLVEVLVVMALTIFIMVILSETFAVGLDTFRSLKAIGDMESQLRTSASILRRDLAADHFEGKRRLSSLATQSGDPPPQEGFFRIAQGPLRLGETAQEGVDVDGIPIRRRTTHVLHFTVKLRGNRPQDFFSARVPDPTLSNLGQPDSRYQQANTYSSQWAEVAFFLAVPSGSPTAEGTTPLYSLHRRQWGVVPDPDELNWGANPVLSTSLPQYVNISCRQNPNTDPLYSGRVYFNSPRDLTIPQRRFAMNPDNNPACKGLFKDAMNNYTVLPTYTPLDNPNRGDDLLLTNVLSFDVQVLLQGQSDFTDVVGYTDAAGGYFDTWSNVKDDWYDYSQFDYSQLTPFPSNILALKITLRIWDTKTKLTRQITIIQDM